jgi:hypothetical protein
MSSRAAFLVQILLPKETGSGEPMRQQWFGLLKELTEKFGGATSSRPRACGKAAAKRTVTASLNSWRTILKTLYGALTALTARTELG